MEGRTVFLYDKPSASVLPQHVDLNNYHCSPFTHEGRFYLAVEHFYQAHKYPVGSADFEAVRKSPTPDQAKKLTRKLHYDKDWWETAKEGIMSQGIRLKYEQNPVMRDNLLLTWDWNLVEDSLQDPYWGGRLEGSKNRLGALLIEERERLRQTVNPLPVAPLAWLLRPVHSCFPLPWHSVLHPTESILLTNSCDSLQQAVLQHPILSLLPQAAVSDLLSTAATYITVPANQQQAGANSLFFVLSGKGVCAAGSQLPIGAGMWVCATAAHIYIAGDEELRVAELSLPSVVNVLTTECSLPAVLSTVVWGEKGHFSSFRSALQGIVASKWGPVAQIASCLQESWPHFLSPETAVDSALFLPVNAATIREYSVSFASVQPRPAYYQTGPSSVRVVLAKKQWEMFAFHLAVFTELRRRIHSETVAEDVISALQEQVPETLEQVLQTGYEAVAVSIEEEPKPQWKSAFEDFAIRESDVILGDISALRASLSPYLQLLSNKSLAFSALNSFGNGNRGPSLQYFLLVNPEQEYRAREVDRALEVYWLTVQGQEVMLLSPRARETLGLGKTEDDRYLLCLNSAGGEVTANLLTEFETAIREVLVIENWQPAASRAHIKTLQSNEVAVQCDCSEGVTAYIPTNFPYLLDPIATQCLQSLSQTVRPSTLSTEVLQTLSRLSSERQIKVKGVIPNSDSDYYSYLESLKAATSLPEDAAILLQCGPSTDQLPSFYGQVYHELSILSPVCEISTFEAVHGDDITKVEIPRVEGLMQEFARRKTERKIVVWSDAQVKELVARREVKVVAVSAAEIDIEQKFSPQRKVTHFCLSHPSPAGQTFAFTLSEGQWRSHLSLPLSSTLQAVLR